MRSGVKGGCVCGGWEHKYFKNAANLYSLSQKPQARVPPASRAPAAPYPELLDSPHWSLGWGAALWGWGSVTRWGGGSPAAWAGCLAPSLSIWAAGTNVPQASAAPWAPTVPDRHCQGVESSWSPTPCCAVWGAPSQPSSPMWYLAAASVLLNTGDSVSKAYFFSHWL